MVPDYSFFAIIIYETNHFTSLLRYQNVKKLEDERQEIVEKQGVPFFFSQFARRKVRVGQGSQQKSNE